MSTVSSNERLRLEREESEIFARGGNKDYWAYTICGGCYGVCGARARVVDGSPVAIESVPESDLGAKGGMCGKGVSTIMDYHDPNRIDYPLKRTNPRKGIGEDPGWKRISWDEAMDTIADRLVQIKKTDPRQLIWGFTPSPGTTFKATIFASPFFVQFGTLNRASGGVGTACGAVAHHIGALVHAAWDIMPDYRYTNFVLRCGGNESVGSGRQSSAAIRWAAAARDRGMKSVVMDPIGYMAASKGTEWIPILPGMDLAVFLAMANLMVNQMGTFDREFIRAKTNAPYLVGPDRLFVRDDQGRPLLWDEADGKAKPYDDPTLAQPAIEGQYTVRGVSCHPGFQLLKDHLRQYTVSWASELSTVPEKTIERLTKELVEQAKIGSTIEIQGRKIPYRPAGLVGYKGVNTHTNGFHQYAALTLINSLLGNQDVCGGILGSGTVRGFGHPETGRPSFQPFGGYDGMLTPGVWFTKAPWPPPEVSGPGLLNFIDIFPHAGRNPYPYCEDWEEIWTKVGRPYEPQALGLYGANTVMSAGNPKAAEAFLKKVPFAFSINTLHNETTEGFVDIVLPECHFLENLDLSASQGFFFNYPIGMDQWDFHPGLPVVAPKFERRSTLDIFLDLADRVGTGPQYKSFLENWFSTRLMKWEQVEAKPGQKSEIVGPDETISNFEFTDRALKFYFGEDKGVPWFMEHGFMSWDKKPEECYWRYFVNARVPVYYEINEHDREEVKERAEKIGMHMEWDQYTPLISYFQSVMYADAPAGSEFDLVAVSPRDSLHTQRFSAENPWVDEMSQNNPYTYNIVMHAETAREKGISDGDVVCVENFRGDTVNGRVHLSQLIHRQAVAMVGLGGWAKGRPHARGKGVNFNVLLPADHRHIDPITGAFEINVKVKAYKV